MHVSEREIAQPAIPFAKQEFLVEKLSMRERERGALDPVGVLSSDFDWVNRT
jgi:hypothetical protein